MNQSRVNDGVKEETDDHFLVLCTVSVFVVPYFVCCWYQFHLMDHIRN